MINDTKWYTDLQMCQNNMMLYDLTECDSVIRIDDTIPYNIYLLQKRINADILLQDGSFYSSGRHILLLQIHLREAKHTSDEVKGSLQL